MIKATITEAKQRFSSLPLSLQDVIFSQHLADLILQVGSENGLPQDKVTLMGEQVGLVLLGFVRPSELASQLQEAVGLDVGLATKLGAIFQNKVFTSLTGDLDKVYAPPGVPSGTGIDMDKVRAMPEFVPSAAPPSVPFGGMPSAPPFAFKAVDAPAPIKTFTPAAPLRTTAPTSTPATSSPDASPAPAPLSAISGGPAPFVLQRGAEVKPVAQGARSSFDQIDFKNVKTSAAAPRPARLEIGNAVKAAPGPARTEMPEAKVVHYTQWKTSSPSAAPSASPAPSGGPVPLSALGGNLSRSNAPAASSSSTPDPKAAFLNRVASVAEVKKEVPPPPEAAASPKKEVAAPVPSAPAPAPSLKRSSPFISPPPGTPAQVATTAPAPKPPTPASPMSPKPPISSPPSKGGGVIDLGSLS